MEAIKILVKWYTGMTFVRKKTKTAEENNKDLLFKLEFEVNFKAADNLQ